MNPARALAFRLAIFRLAVAAFAIAVTTTPEPNATTPSQRTDRTRWRPCTYARISPQFMGRRPLPRPRRRPPPGLSVSRMARNVNTRAPMRYSDPCC